MKNVVDDLISNLSEQINNLNQFEQLLTDQQQMLMKNEVDSLKENLGTQNRLISAAKGIENRRNAILGNFSMELDEVNEGLTLKEICERIDDTYGTKLKEIRQTLINAVEKVNNLRKKNELLIQKSLEIIDSSMKIYLQGDNRGKASYTDSGSAPSSSGSSRMVLNKVV